MQSSSQITNKPTPSFVQAGSPSCRPTNCVIALKESVLGCMLKESSTALIGTLVMKYFTARVDSY